MRSVEYKRNMRLYGHNLELIMTEISDNCYGYELNNEMLDFKIMDDIVKQIKAEKISGEFKAKIRLAGKPGTRGRIIRIKGTWRIRLDYILFYRIVRWWYNCNFDPENIRSLFTKAFEHNANICLEQFETTYNRNIFDFIGYIGNQHESGNAFMDIIAREMEAYEKKYSLSIK